MDCEWMRGDAAPGANLNPFYWTGSLTFEKGISSLEAEKEKLKRDFPVVLKAPSGVLSTEKNFPDTWAAIQWLMENNPAKVSLQQKVEQAKGAVNHKENTILKTAEEIADGKTKLGEVEEKLLELRRQIEEVQASQEELKKQVDTKEQLLATATEELEKSKAYLQECEEELAKHA